MNIYYNVISIVALAYFFIKKAWDFDFVTKNLCNMIIIHGNVRNTNA